MIISDLAYMEAASISGVEGGFASAEAYAGPSTASGIVSALTHDLSTAATVSGLQVGPIAGLPIGFNTATSTANSQSYST